MMPYWLRPLFIPSQTGQLYCAYYPPVNGDIRCAIVHIPAFAEEMNKSRRMVALQAQAFAQQGYAVLVLDLYGTGDSEGDFGAATWEVWRHNIGIAIDWLKQQGAASVSLWGLRTGALLAMDFASCSRHPIAHLIAWQPVVNGDTFVTQFLRLRVAAAMMDNNAPREKTSDLKQQLLEGQAIEVAGYRLNPQLIGPLMALRADQLDLKAVKKIAVFEVVAAKESQVALGNAHLLDALQKQHIPSLLTQIVGDAFWSSQEISTAPDLIAASGLEIGLG